MSRWSMLRRALPRLIFVLYCVEAGLFLVLIPWRDGWTVLTDQFAWNSMRPYLRSAFARALVCAFGTVHLLWGLHDLHEVLGGESDTSPSA